MRGREFASGAVILGISFCREAAATVLLNLVVCLPSPLLILTFLLTDAGHRQLGHRQLWSELAAELHTAVWVLRG